MPAAKNTKLQELLNRPPETWVDAVIVAVVKDPYFYGGLALAVFLVLSLVALWSTRTLIQSIDKEERKKKKATKSQTADDKKTQ